MIPASMQPQPDKLKIQHLLTRTAEVATSDRQKVASDRHLEFEMRKALAGKALQDAGFLETELLFGDVYYTKTNMAGVEGTPFDPDQIDQWVWTYFLTATNNPYIQVAVGYHFDYKGEKLYTVSIFVAFTDGRTSKPISSAGDLVSDPEIYKLLTSQL